MHYILVLKQRWRIGVFALLFALIAAGFTRPATAQSNQSAVGQWSSVMSWPLVGINAALLPNGNVLVYQRLDWPTSPQTMLNQAYVWNINANSFTYVPLTPGPAGDITDLFCSAQSFMSDGRLLVTGGNLGTDGEGSPNTNIFDYTTNTWSRVADMNAGRWYPTNVSMATGEVLVSGGTEDANYTTDGLSQVWTGSGWRNLTSAILNLPLYPYMYLAPNGKAFLSGPNQATQYLDVSGTGFWSSVAARQFGSRDYGASIPYDDGKVLMVGGGDPPTATAEVIDLTVQNPAWRSVGSMASARRQMNATLLPDGTVLVTGGTGSGGFNIDTQAVLTAELWSPITESWTTMASMQEMRLYHSTALLLPDGRVLSAGGGMPAATGSIPDTDHYTAEIYSPPYLFKGARPTIVAAPTNVSWGQTFFVLSPDAPTITNVNLIRMGATTHDRNMDQRINHLSFTQGAGGLYATMPSNPNLCPPGYYLLFILNGNGVPSVASILQVNGAHFNQLSPIADSYVKASTYANTNFGTAKNLIVKTSSLNSNSVNNRCAYLMFDLTGVTQMPSSAKLTLTVDSSSNPVGSNETINLYAIPNAAWTETGITWNNAPGLNLTNFSSTGTLLASTSVPLQPGTVTIDLTGFVQANMGSVVTLQILDPLKENILLAFESREAPSGQPYLMINY